MMGYGDGGWAWMAFMPLIWIVLIGLIVWAVVRLAGPSHGGCAHESPHASPHLETPEEILDRRFALGEIDADAYTEARQRLAAHRSG